MITRFPRRSPRRGRTATPGHTGSGLGLLQVAEEIATWVQHQHIALAREAFAIGAQAAAIYSKAYGMDQEFYSFYRSLRAYRESFADKRDVLVLDPKSDFFRYLEKSKP